MDSNAAVRYSTCRACGARILWLKTTKGKNIPCDPGVIRFHAAGGPETFVTVDGKVERGQRQKDGAAWGYISHFATCPQADRFRKKAPIINDYDEHRYSGLLTED